MASGSRLPPLTLDDEEALAVAVSLRDAAINGVLGSDHAALSALLKLHRMLPRRVADRLVDLDGAFEHTVRTDGGEVSSAVLLEIASACRRGELLRLSYRDIQGRDSVRDIQPHRLVRSPHRWYLVAFDMDKRDWRTFRVDRVREVHPTGMVMSTIDAPDAAALVAKMLVSDYPMYAAIRLSMGLQDARRVVPPHRGSYQVDGPDTLVTIGGTTASQLASYLFSLDAPLVVVSPDAVREELRSRVDAMLGPPQALETPTHADD
ncbi:WYL domain-containing protein [Mycolicibacterium cosmeticum]|uniref:helix-turn-helix transcriptional regulator n=1 Tax=Mycolicibacterium cosmeticum TaxID=258533 RepID=UPI003204C57B